MGLLMGLKVSLLSRAQRLCLTCAAQKCFISTMDLCFHLPQYLISTHKEAIFYTVSFMQGENKFIVLVVTYSVKSSLMNEKAKITQECTWCMCSLNLFLGFHYERGEVEKVKQFREGHFDAFFNNNSYPCCGCNCGVFCFGGRGGNQWLQIYLFLSNADHILFHRMRKNILQQFLEAEGFPIWGKQGNFTRHFNLTAHLDY